MAIFIISSPLFSAVKIESEKIPGEVKILIESFSILEKNDENRLHKIVSSLTKEDLFFLGKSIVAKFLASFFTPHKNIRKNYYSDDLNPIFDENCAAIKEKDLFLYWVCQAIQKDYQNLLSHSHFLSWKRQRPIQNAKGDAFSKEIDRKAKFLGPWIEAFVYSSVDELLPRFGNIKLQIFQNFLNISEIYSYNSHSISTDAQVQDSPDIKIDQTPPAQLGPSVEEMANKVLEKFEASKEQSQPDWGPK